VDQNFRIISDAYPYIASRLLTDSSIELQSALQKLLFKDESLRWERLQELLEKASDTNDYDVTLAVDQMITYLISEKGQPIREILALQMVEVFDQMESEAIELLLKFSSSGNAVSTIVSTIRMSETSEMSSSASTTNISDRILDLIEQSSSTASTSTLLSLGQIIRVLRSSKGISSNKLSSLLRKVFSFFSLILFVRSSDIRL
jgi:hypothetical protein